MNKTLIHPSWNPILQHLNSEELQTLNNEILPNISFQPERALIFKAFSLPVKEVKVVILGQSPYSIPGKDLGLAMATSSQKLPVPLRNIQKELLDSGCITSEELDLQSWFKQGVLLLNTSLTVETGKPDSHSEYWKGFTENVIRFLSKENPCVWLLFGKTLQNYSKDIYNAVSCSQHISKNLLEEIPIRRDNNYIISCPHPAAEAYSGGKAGFFGSNCFNNTNIILQKMKNTKINW